jgi:hypothetical protein
MVHINGENEAYRLWLLQALLGSYERYEPEERIVLLHSWNEWCEGTYLEPDARRGRFFLEETRNAISIAHEVIRGLQTDNPPLAAELLRMYRMKDEAAFKVMQASRMHSAYVWYEAERRRERIIELEAKLARLSNRAEGQDYGERSELERAELAVLQAEAKLNALMKSTSWRLTAPVRGLGRLLRRR